VSEIDPNVVYQKLFDAGNEWADAEAAAALLEESKKSVLADIMNKVVEKSVAAKEQYALQTQGYQDHLRAMVEARRVANQARVKYNAMKVWADMWRTQEATKRVEMQQLSRTT
jgi:hypothetical protein